MNIGEACTGKYRLGAAGWMKANVGEESSKGFKENWETRPGKIELLYQSDHLESKRLQMTSEKCIYIQF